MPDLTLKVHARAAVAIASATSLAIGLVFIFVWAPHPWGWQGIDAYHTLARELARGEPFGTTDVPWGYAYFAAAIYRIFGEHVWLPLTIQVAANALTPVLLYGIVVPLADRRTAAVAALLVGVLSFNTVYASTQSSDALSTVFFMAALYLLVRADRSGQVLPLLGSGILLGIAPQFRPNLVLFPAVVAVLWVWRGRWSRRAWATAAVFVATALVMQLPWIVRNYQLTGLILPTSTHGGVQLWYGTLQTGPFLESRAHNPRSLFESAPFPYTSLANRSIVVTATYGRCLERPGEAASMVYWSDRDSEPRRLPPASRDGDHLTFEIPGQAAPTVVYYYMESAWPATGAEPAQSFYHPADGPEDPFVVFVSTDHLGDLDHHDDLLDIFDTVRGIRHFVWQEPAPQADLDRDGVFSRGDFDALLARLLPETKGVSPVRNISIASDIATLELTDGSTLGVPRHATRHTDLVPSPGLAGELLARWITRRSLRPGERVWKCPFGESVATNGVFYRREPHLMNRYMALALDNIAREPLAFALASAYRSIRLFVIRGSTDVATTQQFSSSRLSYTAGTVLSATYLALFIYGAWVCCRRRSAMVWLLVPIAYVPLTICFVLTNMRYTVTVQPLILAFVAVALLDAQQRLRRPQPGTP